MNKEDIIRMAYEAGLVGKPSENSTEFLEAFAALVASAEREACAKWLEDVVDAPNWAEIIRARGQA